MKNWILAVVLFGILVAGMIFAWESLTRAALSITSADCWEFYVTSGDTAPQGYRFNHCTGEAWAIYHTDAKKVDFGTP